MSRVSTARLTAVFPFQIATDLSLSVMNVGPSLAKICPSVKIGDKLENCIRFIRPSIPLRLDILKRRANSLVQLESIAEKVALRGQYMVDEDENVILFAITPLIQVAAEMETLQLSAHDFAPSDPRLDFLIALQVKETLLGDALRLNAELTERKKSLEKVKEELSLQVQERQRAEEALTSAHAALTARLQVITEQQHVIARMSVPSIDVWQGVVALPALAMLNEDRLARLREAIMQTASRSDVVTVIVDLTGVEIIEDNVPERLVELARIANLLGRKCFFSGVNAALARRFVEAGVDLSGVEFLPNVRVAIARAVGERRAFSSGSEAR